MSDVPSTSEDAKRAVALAISQWSASCPYLLGQLPWMPCEQLAEVVIDAYRAAFREERRAPDRRPQARHAIRPFMLPPDTTEEWDLYAAASGPLLPCGPSLASAAKRRYSLVNCASGSMAWHKRKGDSAYSVYVYRASVGKKVYVGRRALEREARELFRQKTDEFAREAGKATVDALTVREYAAEWLRDNHGPGTKRPVATTLQVNRTNLAPFLKEFGDRELDGGISRKEALSWSRQHRHNAKSVSAMFNDAVDEEQCKQNPFANRKQEQSRERKDIHPLTEDEVDRLAGIALRHWGEDGYGLTARAWVLFAAWVGCRPGETFNVTIRDLNFRDGVATIKRVKRRGKVYPVDKVAFPQAARDAINAMPVLPREGPIFLTVTGKPMVKGSLRYHWAPIRDAFREVVGEDRWRELIDFEDGREKTLHLYSARHFCASVMADRGATEYDIAAQLGNSVEVCRETYIHAYAQRQLERNRLLLERPAVVDLASRRKGA